MKIEAMSEEEIKDLVGCYHLGDNRFGIGSSTLQDLERMAYTWATAKAEAEKLELRDAIFQNQALYDFNRANWTDADWLQSVLQRIGWPKDDGQGEGR